METVQEHAGVTPFGAQFMSAIGSDSSTEDKTATSTYTIDHAEGPFVKDTDSDSD